MPTMESKRRIGHRRNDIAAQIVARAFEFRKAFEYHGQRSTGFARADHVDVQFREMIRVSGQAVGQRSAALQHAQDVLHQRAERRPLGQFDGDGQRAIQRHAGVEQRGELLREEQNVFLLAAGERRQLDLEGFLGFLADVDRREPLAAQFVGDQALGFAMDGAGTNLPVGCYGAEMKARHRKACHG